MIAMRRVRRQVVTTHRVLLDAADLTEALYLMLRSQGESFAPDTRPVFRVRAVVDGREAEVDVAEGSSLVAEWDTSHEEGDTMEGLGT
jgi:hypothetical protein